MFTYVTGRSSKHAVEALGLSVCKTSLCQTGVLQASDVGITWLVHGYDCVHCALAIIMPRLSEGTLETKFKKVGNHIECMKMSAACKGCQVSSIESGCLMVVQCVCSQREVLL